MMSAQNTITLRIVYAICLLVTGTIALTAQERLIIQHDQPLTIQLDGEGWTELTYTAASAEWVAISARSLEEAGVLDLTLEILGPQGRRVAGGFADDHTTADSPYAPTDALLPQLYLPAPGDYRLRINSFNGVSVGQAEVLVSEVDRFRVQSTETSDQRQLLVYLPANDIYYYTFAGQAGETLTITVRDTSGTLDLLLTLVDAEGTLLASNDDHPVFSTGLDLFDAALVGLTLPAGGVYTLEVRDFLGMSGTLEVLLDRQ